MRANSTTYLLYTCDQFQNAALKYREKYPNESFLLGPLNPDHLFRGSDIVVIFGELNSFVEYSISLFSLEAFAVFLSQDGETFENYDLPPIERENIAARRKH